MRATLVIILLAAIALSGCSSGTNTNGNRSGNSNNANQQINTAPTPPPTVRGDADPNYQSCNPYFPLVPNSRVTYAMIYSSGAVADVTVVVDEETDGAGRKVYVEKTHIIDQATRGNQIDQITERRYICDGERIQIVVENTDAKVEGKASAAVINYRPNSVIMTDPASLARPGTTWTLGFTTKLTGQDTLPINPNEMRILSLEVKGIEDVKLPVGTFKAVKIERRGTMNPVFDYFVKGLGLVRRENADGTRMELKEYGGLQPKQ